MPESNRPGLGYWVRGKHETLLIGKRGKIPAPAPGTQYCSVIEAKADAHSAKPAIFAEMIERMFPNVARLEMFCRSPRPGWTVHGDGLEDGGEERPGN